METQNALLAEIERAIDRLKVDFDRFFNGALPIPPEEQRTELKRRLRNARALRLRTFAERFYLNTLEARFNTLSELFNRRLREQEVSGTAPSVAAQKPMFDPAEGVVLGKSAGHAAVTALYNTLYRADGRNTKTDFDSFSRYLRRQIKTLQDKTGCEKVRFRVTSADGVPALRAKPIK